MAFTNRVVSEPNRYTLTDAEGNTKTVYLTPDPGDVVTEGTPLNAENLNKEIKALAQQATGAKADSAGNLKCNNIQRGTVSMPTKGASGKTVSVAVKFKKAFSAAPTVVATPYATRPDGVNANVGEITTTGFNMYCCRSTAAGNKDTKVKWIAVV